MKTTLILIALTSLLGIIAGTAFGRTRTERAYDAGFVAGEHEAFVNGKRCREPMQGISTRVGEWRAHAGAVQSWGEQVESLHGSEWAIYSNSVVIEDKCIPAHPGDWFTLKCRVVARPCKG